MSATFLDLIVFNPVVIIGCCFSSSYSTQNKQLFEVRPVFENTNISIVSSKSCPAGNCLSNSIFDIFVPNSIMIIIVERLVIP